MKEDKLQDDYEYTDSLYRRAEGGYWMEVDDDIVPFNSVTYPRHYTEGFNYGPRKVIADWGLNFNLGNVVKYIVRAGRKDTTKVKEDLLKAKQYLEFELEKYDNQS